MAEILAKRPGVTTSIEHANGAVRFVVTTADALYQDRLDHLGYAGVGDGRFATAWFPSSASACACYERFAASIEQMILQSARLVRVPWEDALQECLRRLEGYTGRWWLYGSTALAVRGLDIEPGDIDIHVDDPSAGGIFDDILVTPVQEMRNWIAAFTGRAFSHAIVEWLSGPRADRDDPRQPHEQGPYVADRLETVEWHGQRLAVPPLSAQLHTCIRRGLDDRAGLIRATMDA